MANCLVLGADGFMGSHVVEALAKVGHLVRAFDRLKSSVPLNLPADNPNIQLCPGDFLNRHDLDRALKDMQYVFHFVSTTNPAASAKDPLIDVDTNIRMSVVLMQLCVEHNVKRLVFPSTGGAIYGQDRSRPLCETDLTEPVSPYGIGKLAIEGYLRYFNQSHGLDSLVFRVSNAYGERQNVVGSQGAIAIFLNLIERGLPIRVFGDGAMVRDYVYISDLAGMVVEAFDGHHQFDTYNVGSGIGVSLNELIDSLRQVTGRAVKVEYLPARSTDVQHAVLDTARYAKEFGKPQMMSLTQGLEETWRYVVERAKKEHRYGKNGL
jgi:UDP-glucose 4-epimerase